ncbi:MAG: TolC family protein [Cellvibrionaceae bacterium]|nr:TolC family protein [Cellvibrionaceae bacterium]
MKNADVGKEQAKRLSWRGLTWLLLLVAGLVGCVSSERKTQESLAAVASALPSKFAEAGEQNYGELRQQVQRDLLALFDSQTLTALIREALANNADLNATAKRLQASRLLLRQVNAQQLPKADASIDAGREKNAGLSQSSRSRQLAISWELDLWGRLADQSAAARQLYAAEQQGLRAARNSIASQVARSGLLLWALAEVIAIEQQRIQILDSLKRTTATYYREGLTQLEDVGVVNIELESARAALDELQQNYVGAQRDLEVLLGRYPDASIQWGRELPVIKQPQLTVPAALLAERPDIQAAFAAVIAGSKLSDAAYKAMLPSITLGAAASRLSGAALLGDSADWSLVAGLSQPLFQGGALLAEAEASSAKAEAAVFDYKQTVLSAMQEVEQALSQDRSLARRSAYYQVAKQQAERVLEDYKMRYRSGLVGILELLQVQQQTLDLRSALIQVQAARLDNRIVLGLALGLGVNSEAEQRP